MPGKCFGGGGEVRERDGNTLEANVRIVRLGRYGSFVDTLRN